MLNYPISLNFYNLLLTYFIFMLYLIREYYLLVYFDLIIDDLWSIYFILILFEDLLELLVLLITILMESI
jgi:hypothetical protein